MPCPQQPTCITWYCSHLDQLWQFEGFDARTWCCLPVCTKEEEGREKKACCMLSFLNTTVIFKTWALEIPPRLVWQQLWRSWFPHFFFPFQETRYLSLKCSFLPHSLQGEWTVPRNYLACFISRSSPTKGELFIWTSSGTARPFSHSFAVGL